MRAILGFFFKRWVLSLLGLIALSLIIWFVGPLFAFAGYKPLEPEVPRWILIGIAVVLWIGRRIWKWAKALQTNRQLLGGLAAPAAPPNEGERASWQNHRPAQFRFAIPARRTPWTGSNPRGGRHPQLRLVVYR